MATSPGLSTTWGRSDWSAVVIEALILESALLKSGATRVVTDARIQNVPRLKIHPTSAWVAELQEIPSDSGDADILSLVPRKIGNVISVSTESVEDASVDELQEVANSMVRGLGVAIDAAAFSSATATSLTPAGLLNATLPGATGGVSIDSILAAVGAIQGHGGNPDTCFINPSDVTILRQLKATTGQYILAPDAASVEGAPATRVGGTQLIPTAGLAAGHALVAEARFIQTAIRRDASVDFSGDAQFTADAITARLTMRIDWSWGDVNAAYLLSP